MQRVPRITKPLVKSQLSASAEVDRWSRSRNQSFVQDLDGLRWRSTIETPVLKPCEGELEFIYSAEYFFSAEATSEDLLRTGTLDNKDDERILSLLNQRKILFCLSRQRVAANSFEEIDKSLRISIQNYRTKIQNVCLKDFKRHWIYRILEQQTSFGSV